VSAGLRGWRAQPGYIDAAHRVHARVEDGIRTGKDCGIGRFPSRDFAINSAWLAVSLSPRLAVLAAAHRPGRRPGQSGTEDLALPDSACGRETGPRRPPAAAENRRYLPWADDIAPPGPGSPPCHRPPDQRKATPATRKEKPRARGTPAAGPPAGPPSYPNRKITNRSAVQPPPGPAIRRVNDQG